jgi:hypothetical protein
MKYQAAKGVPEGDFVYILDGYRCQGRKIVNFSRGNLII